MSRPLVSIVMTTYQHAAFIADAIESALAQTYPDIEIVIADDGSTDGAWEIIQSYAARHPDRIVLLPQKPNGGIDGIFENSRRAFLACRGKYIAILEGDDLYLPEKIERQVAWLEADERRVLCATDTEVFDSDTGASQRFSVSQHPLSEGVGPRRFIYDLPFATVSIMFRRSVMPPHAVHPRLRIAGDWFLFFECLAGDGHYGSIDAVLARHRRHGNNITSRLRDIHFRDFLVTLDMMEERRPDLAEDCRRSRASLYYGWGVLCLRRGEMREARESLLLSLRTRFRWKPLLAAMVATLPGAVAPPIARWYERR